jgi:hypothetical protein
MFDSDLWRDILEKLFEIVHDVPDFKQNVTQGDRFPPDSYPFACVIPAIITSAPMTFQEDSWYYNFEIGIGVQGDNPDVIMIEAFRLANKICAAIEADRKLTIKDESSQLNRALVSTTHVTQIVPDWRKHNQGLEIYWVGVIVQCRKKQ